MRSLLAKRWFLVLLIGGVTLAGVMPDGVRPATEQVRPRVVVPLALFLMSWGLDNQSLRRAVLHPLPALWAVAISYGALPLLALLISKLMPSDDLRIGLMITASVPCTLASAVLWTRMAGGNDATALLVIMLTTATSWLATPPWLVLGTGVQVGVNTAELMLELLLFLVLPVGLGQLSRAVGPLGRVVTRYRTPIGVVSQMLIFVVIMKAAVDVRDRLGEHSAAVSVMDLLSALMLCLGAHLIALVTGLWTSRLWGFDRGDGIAVAFACSQKTLPVALLLFDGYFRQSYPLAVVPLVFYHVGQLIVDTFIADALLHRKLSESELPEELVD